MHKFHRSYTNVRNESWKKHFEVNMWNVSFVQYLSVPAFTEWFVLVSIQFQISSGYLLNFHLGWQVVLMSCAKICILMKGLRRKYFWSRQCGEEEISRHWMKHLEGLRKEGASFLFAFTPVVMRTTDWFWPLNDLQWLAVTSGDYYIATQKWKPESELGFLCRWSW